MNTLFDIAGISARIFHLPNRLPFMTATDLAEVYGTTPKRINEAVSRNPERFPNDFMFDLKSDEAMQLKSQNATSMMANRALPKAFTHAGAYALSAVLKTPIAAEVSVTIHRAFAAMEARAKDYTDDLLKRLAYEAAGPKSLRVKVIMSEQNKWDFEKCWKMAKGPSKNDVRDCIHECVRAGLIAAPLVGTPYAYPLKPSAADGQLSFFGGAA
jgi:ORF6N domain